MEQPVTFEMLLAIAALVAGLVGGIAAGLTSWLVRKINAFDTKLGAFIEQILEKLGSIKVSTAQEYATKRDLANTEARLHSDMEAMEGRLREDGRARAEMYKERWAYIEKRLNGEKN